MNRRRRVNVTARFTQAGIVRDVSRRLLVSIGPSNNNTTGQLDGIRNRLPTSGRLSTQFGTFFSDLENEPATDVHEAGKFYPLAPAAIVIGWFDSSTGRSLDPLFARETIGPRRRMKLVAPQNIPGILNSDQRWNAYGITSKRLVFDPNDGTAMPKLYVLGAGITDKGMAAQDWTDLYITAKHEESHCRSGFDFAKSLEQGSTTQSLLKDVAQQVIDQFKAEVPPAQRTPFLLEQMEGAVKHSTSTLDELMANVFTLQDCAARGEITWSAMNEELMLLGQNWNEVIRILKTGVLLLIPGRPQPFYVKPTGTVRQRIFELLQGIYDTVWIDEFNDSVFEDLPGGTWKVISDQKKILRISIPMILRPTDD